MSQGFQAPRGIPDYYPPASADFRRVRDTLTDAARRAGYGHIELPIFEDTALFARGVGESTDVVAAEDAAEAEAVAEDDAAAESEDN